MEQSSTGTSHSSYSHKQYLYYFAQNITIRPFDHYKSRFFLQALWDQLLNPSFLKPSKTFRVSSDRTERERSTSELKGMDSQLRCSIDV